MHIALHLSGALMYSVDKQTKNKKTIGVYFHNGTDGMMISDGNELNIFLFFSFFHKAVNIAKKNLCRTLLHYSSSSK